MKTIKNILLLVMLLAITSSLASAKEETETKNSTILLEEKEDTRSYWDKLSDKLKDEDDEDDEETYWDKFTDLLPTDEIDEMLYDISDSIDIDDKEESMVESLEDSLPDMLSKPATYAVKSASDMMRATLINDDEMDRLAIKDLKKMDNNQTIAKDIDRYYIDLQNIMKKIDIPTDLKLDVKVYMSPFLYIFTMPNGAIRVNSGIIEALDDNEVLFLMAHEIGHLKEKDHKASYRKAHAMFALENAINMSGEIVASASNGVLESVTSSMRKSQFQKDEEFAADEYAIDVLKKNGIDKKSAVDALEYLQYMNAPLLKIHPTAHERIKHIKDDL
ncbi:MAG: M48 family metalloprotease [Sulfurovaceae bacterium]|nr:M48 family metalloprotease [Sulfurovaceae bacterium]